MQPIALGDFTIHKFVESTGNMGVPPQAFAGMTDDRLATLRPAMDPRCGDPASGLLYLSMHSFVLRTGGKTILIDTCNGNHKQRSGVMAGMSMLNHDYLGNLARLGLEPDDIDVVLCTHLHSDHVGWNTKQDNGRWVPTFPKARYLFSRKDYDAFDPRRQDWPHYGGTDEDTFLDSVLPVVEAGQVEFVDGEHRVGDGLTILPCPGHSPGHTALRVEDSGDSGLFTGDSMHHPIQIANTNLNSFTCWDADLARASRRKLLEECCEHHRLLVPGHFAAPHCGRVSPKGSMFQFEAGA